MERGKSVALARRCGPVTIDYTDVDTRSEVLAEPHLGRGPDACIDAVGMEAHAPGAEGLVEGVKQFAQDRGRPPRRPA